MNGEAVRKEVRDGEGRAKERRGDAMSKLDT